MLYEGICWKRIIFPLINEYVIIIFCFQKLYESVSCIMNHYPSNLSTVYAFNLLRCLFQIYMLAILNMMLIMYKNGCARRTCVLIELSINIYSNNYVCSLCAGIILLSAFIQIQLNIYIYVICQMAPLVQRPK